MPRAQTIVLLQRMIDELGDAARSGRWDRRTAELVDLGERIGEVLNDRKASRPRRFELPQEPSGRVRDVYGIRWHPAGIPGEWMNEARVCANWVTLLADRGPLTEDVG